MFAPTCVFFCIDMKLENIESYLSDLNDQSVLAMRWKSCGGAPSVVRQYEHKASHADVVLITWLVQLGRFVREGDEIESHKIANNAHIAQKKSSANFWVCVVCVFFLLFCH